MATGSMRQCLLIVAASLVLGGCADNALFTRLDERLIRGDCPAAIALIDTQESPDSAAENLPLLLNAAMVYLQCGDFDQAQHYFRMAEDLAERLWTESVTRNALSLVTNDRVMAYAGEDFERVMIHLMSAIGYLQAGQSDEALVEVRRLNTLLTLYNDKYAEKNVYKDDAFARYLSGMLREADGDWDGAFIDYRKAVQVYRDDYRIYGTRVPESLLVDLVRAAKAADRLSNVAELIPGEAVERWLHDPVAPDYGKLVFVTFAGYAPEKVQDMVVVPTPYGPVGVAFPRMVITSPRCGSGRISVYGREHFYESDLTMVEDINRIAVKNLDDRRGRILAKAVARAAAKQIAIHSIARSSERRDDQQTIAAILNLVNILLVERADTRSWRTLPGRIYMTRLYLPAGDYTAELEACGTVNADLGAFTISPGGMRFLFRDLRYPVATTTGSTD